MKLINLSTLIFLIFSLLITLTHQQFTHNDKQQPRRILHQPLFPVSSDPPPATEPPPENVNSGQPFFPQAPPTPNTDQPPPPPPYTAAPDHEAAPIPTATQPSKHAKTLAIVVSVGVVTFGMLSALAFFLYRHKIKQRSEAAKFNRVREQNNVRMVDDECRTPPSRVLYIGTVEPTRVSFSESGDGSDDDDEVPYSERDGSGKRSDRYRPSPDLQPLPPLSRAAPPVHETVYSDEESYDGTFYTPQGSSIGPEDGIYTPVSRPSQGGSGNWESYGPRSKRTSPKSRISGSSPDVKNVIVPSIKQAPPRPPPMPSLYPPTRPKFSAPPPPPDLARLRSISNSSSHLPPVPPPPPPPPRPPVLSTPRKVSGSDVSSLSMPQNLRPQMDGLSPKVDTHNSNIIRSRSEHGISDGNGEVRSGSMFSEKVGVDDGDSGRPKLKPLHWDKVRASSDRATVWDQLNAGSFQLNEDRMESLFGRNSANSVPKGLMGKSVLPPVEKENRVLDPKKSQNIAILLRALNVTRDEVSEALLDGHPESLGAELLETLVKMAPTKEEEIKLHNYNGDISKLGSAERFLKAVLDVPFAFKRVEAMLYRANFDGEVKYLRRSFETLEKASQELKNSRLFLKLLEAVLRTGNRMNVGTNRGDAKSFKLETLLKLVDVKGTDGKTTLLHFVVQEIIRSQGAKNGLTDDNNMLSKTKDDGFRKEGLQVVAGLSRDLGNVKKAAGMDSEVLSNYVTKLQKGLEVVRAVLQYENPDMQGNFFDSMRTFLEEAEEEIDKVKTDEKKALSLVKDVTAYFHGDSGKEEAHPLRMFMIVRDFLSILDNVCKDVGRLQDHAINGSARSFRIPAAASLPVLHRYNVRRDISSDEESSSP